MDTESVVCAGLYPHYHYHVGGHRRVQEGQRRIPVQYAKRVRGTKFYGGSARISRSGELGRHDPADLCSLDYHVAGRHFCYFVGAQVEWVRTLCVISNLFSSSGVFYWLLYFGLVVAFTYFYTDMIFRQQNLPDTLQRWVVLSLAFARRAHGRLPQWRTQADHAGWALFLACAILPSWCAWWWALMICLSPARAVDRGGRSARHDEAARGAALDAPLRRFHP
jgi:hypothetical protein